MNKTRWHLWTTAIGAIFAVWMALAGPAVAAQIPKGDYVCSSSRLGYAGAVHIKKQNKYTLNEGRKGKYSFSRKHKILTFKTGDYKSFFGRYSKESKGSDVFDKKVGYYGWTCYRD